MTSAVSVMIVTPMNPQPSHVRHPSSDSGSHITSTFASPATLSQEPSTTQSMLSTLPTTAPTGHGPGMSKRPKLSLQTTSLPITYGKSTTGLSLSLAASSTASPTVLNTFNNAYELVRSSTSFSGDASPSKSKITSPYPSSRCRELVPYQLPLGVRSILRNSPISTSSRRQRSVSMAGNSMNGCNPSRRLLFPASKQVSYRYPLEEEIKTVRFTARHSDIPDDSESEVSDGSQSDDGSGSSASQSDSSSSEEEASTCKSISPITRPKRKRRKSSNTEARKIQLSRLDGLDEGGCELTGPQTPCQEHPKRRREWRWTLGPLESSDAAADHNATDSNGTSATSTSSSSMTDMPCHVSMIDSDTETSQ